MAPAILAVTVVLVKALKVIITFHVNSVLLDAVCSLGVLRVRHSLYIMHYVVCTFWFKAYSIYLISRNGVDLKLAEFIIIPVASFIFTLYFIPT